MNRLWLRLTLAFIIVTQLSIVVVAALASTQITGEFRRYVVQRDITILRDAPQTRMFFFRIAQPGPPPSPPDMLFTATMPKLMLADASGKVIYDPSGQRVNDTLDPVERANAVPVSGMAGGGEVIGYAVPGSSDMFITTPEQGFLSQLNTILVIAALLVSGIGALIGLVISRMLVAPLASLTQAARAFAAHDWTYRVQAKGPREIAAVAHAFNEMAGEINRAETLRRNLTADIAHELRTPLAVMQCNLRSLLDGVVALTQAEIATLYDETRLLSRLVDDLRELALADAGKLNLNMARIQVGEFLSGVVNGFAAVADDVRITLSTNGQLMPVRADTDRLTQILRNLIVNALRHTASGAVHVSAESTARGVTVSVIDNGEGIASQDLPHVFERFYRGDRSRTRANGGTGLGLAITKAMVEAMGGKIGVESRPGLGCRFWFTLPVDAAAQKLA
jgi:signal transduction histidine kinase